MACNFCNADLYIKAVNHSMPLLAPATRAEKLRQELENITGEVYIHLVTQYCPICGEKKGRQTINKCCSTCGYYNTDRNDPPCCTCVNFGNYKAMSETEERRRG